MLIYCLIILKLCSICSIYNTVTISKFSWQIKFDLIRLLLVFSSKINNREEQLLSRKKSPFVILQNMNCGEL